MRKRYSVLAAVLALCLLLTACGGLDLDGFLETLEAPGESTGFTTPSISMPVIDIPDISIPDAWAGRDHYRKPALEEGETPFGDMEYVRPDVDDFLAQVQEIRERAAQGEGAIKLVRALDKVYEAYDEFWTMDSLADIRYCLDMTDTYYKEEFEYCEGRGPELDTALDEMYYDLASYPDAGKLESLMFGRGFFDAYQGDASDSVWQQGFGELLSAENKAENQYYEVMGRIQEQFADADFSRDGYNAYYRAMEEAAGPVLVELVKIRQQQARMLGYEDFESFAYDWYYGRDYTPAEAFREAGKVAEYLVPIYERVWAMDSSYDLLEAPANTEDMVDYAASAVKAMGGELSEPFDCMMRRDLVDMEPGMNKYNGSFEVYLTGFEVPFVLVNPTGTVEDLSTLAHEFGHFVNDYVTGGSYVSQDVSEIFSQGMEYLCLEYADDAFDMDLIRRARMIDCLDTYVEQMAYHTFERELYRIPVEELTVARINTLYGEIARRFGFDAVGWDKAEWTDVVHFFTEPFYAVSYVVSNDAAMQIYQRELEDPGAGVALYCDMVQADEDNGLLDFLSAYDLENPLAEDRVPQLAALFRELLLEE